MTDLLTDLFTNSDNLKSRDASASKNSSKILKNTPVNWENYSQTVQKILWDPVPKMFSNYGVLLY